MNKLLASIGVVVLVGFAGTAAVFAGSAPSFASAGSYATGKVPWSVAIADLNGDGKPDLATANIEGKTVSVLLNRGDGTFATKRDYRTGQRPVSVAIGDLNGDGTPDLAVASDYANTVSVLLNRGDGSFWARRDYRTGRSPISVAIDDVNGDGTPDLATANAGAGTVSLLLNRGDGSFQAKRDSPAGRVPVSVAIGDLNGDGTPDMVTANGGAGTVSVLLNKGDGSFRARRQYVTGYDPRSIAIGDLNGDGTPDLVTANYYRADRPSSGADSVAVLLNRGDGSFRAKHEYRTGRGPVSVAIGDLNGDGEPDLATADPGPDGNPVRTVSVLLSRGDGSFRARLDFKTRHSPEAVAIGDLNGDGKLDLVTASFDANSVSVLLNSP